MNIKHSKAFQTRMLHTSGPMQYNSTMYASWVQRYVLTLLMS